MALYASATSSSGTTRSKTRPGSIVPDHTSPMSSEMYARTGATPPRTPTLDENICCTGSSGPPAGTPTYPTRPPGRAESSACCMDSFVPTHSSAASAPTTSSRSMTRATPSAPRSATTSVAPNRAQPDRAVADDDDGRARSDPAGERRVVAGAHDVAQGQDARQQGRVRVVRGRHQRAVRERDAHVLALTGVRRDPVVVRLAPPAELRARGVDPVATVHARVVADREGRDHELAGAHRTDVRTDLLDDPDELVADPVRLLGGPDPAVRPEVGAAHARCHDAHDRVGRQDDAGVGDRLEADVEGAVDDGGAHGMAFRRTFRGSR